MREVFFYVRILFSLIILEDCYLISNGEPNNNSPSTCSCGVVNRVIPLIVGGKKISYNRYPWLALVNFWNNYHCGGTLISSQHVLTAGHCVLFDDEESVTPEHLSVVLGAHNLLNDDEHSRIYRRVEAIKLHENFHGDEVHDVHDIALLKLDKEVTYSRHVGPVCLPGALDENLYKIPKGKVIGWGSENYNGFISNIPSEVELDILSHEECEKVNEYDFDKHFIEERGSMFCAYTYKHDACKGDSGGPFVVENSQNQIVQIGIVSWGIKCAKKGIPGVYTKLTSYINWMEKNANISIDSCNFL